MKNSEVNKMATKQKKRKTKQPEQKVTSGKFSLTIWPQKRILSSGDKDDISYIERTVELKRVCLQFSQKNRHTGKWINQQIWFNLDHLSDLGELLEKLSEEYTEEEESSSSSSSGVEHEAKSRFKVYRIISCLKSNLMELPYDTHDLEERGVHDIFGELGIAEVLTDFEAKLLYDELDQVFRRNEVSEVARCVLSGT